MLDLLEQVLGDGPDKNGHFHSEKNQFFRVVAAVLIEGTQMLIRMWKKLGVTKSTKTNFVQPLPFA